MQRFRGRGKKKKIDSHCQVCKVYRPTAFPPSSGTHAASLLPPGMEFKQPYLIPKNLIFPKLAGLFGPQHFIVWVQRKSHSVRVEISGGHEAQFKKPRKVA